MEDSPGIGHVIIVVEGGFVSEVYTTLIQDIEVEIFDVDCAKQESPEAVENLENTLAIVRVDHQQIF